MLDAVITAGGRLSPASARRFGTDVKALVRVGGRSLLDAVIAALRGVPAVGRVIVVGPASARATVDPVDEWVDEFPTGEENLLAALRAGMTARMILSASDLPFVTASSYGSLIDRAGETSDAAYPIYSKDEFLRAYPGGRDRFARLADGEWTGGSAFVVNRDPFLRNSKLLERGFGARKSLTALAALLGPALLLRYAMGRVRIKDVEDRASSLLGATVRAIRGSDPALAMDCDDAADFSYAHAEGTA
jgi:GTP:adenosylcobinamide-phosphate guanylyltransferase